MDTQPTFRAAIKVACILLLAMAVLVIVSVHYGVRVHSASRERTWSDVTPIPDIPLEQAWYVTGGGGSTLFQGSHKGPTPLTPAQQYNLTQIYEYNISGGNALGSMLSQVFAPTPLTVVTNETFSGDGANDIQQHQLTTDMDGLRGAPAHGRMTVIRALEQVLKGTPCQYEIFGTRGVYVFCRSHIVFPIITDPMHTPNSKTRDKRP